ncbi:helix-turn-helix domain-containing protein [Variovorax terrae]|uniref:Helix-turn-helix domain-containing protein n=1 Tax=Variovorax terrae TaxID=2923278 RepID=A0A9X1VX49_9BURK|nr:helix-turn-helix domain-containing protein [Variovorax terrae]MCJ0763562.1 helix-turn-helix domain-containing protein [Variovorax terrae]
MNESAASMADPSAALTPVMESAVAAGALLRQAREAAGLHIAALAVSLKVPVKKLEALEAGRLDLLPDAVFVRALASSVCRTLKADPAPILDRLPQLGAPLLKLDQSGLNAPYRAPSDAPRPSLWGSLSRPGLLAVLALLLAALVLLLLPAMPAPRDEPPVAAAVPEQPLPAVADSAAAAAAALPAAARLPDEAEAGAGQSKLPAAATPAAPAVAAASTAGAPLPSASAAVAAPPAVAAAAMPAATSGIVVFKARGESWVEVTDAKGTVPLRRIMASGETVGASGALPLSVIVGRADSTQVEVRGKPLDLVPLARDNVARFEVK